MNTTFEIIFHCPRKLWTHTFLASLALLCGPCWGAPRAFTQHHNCLLDSKPQNYPYSYKTTTAYKWDETRYRTQAQQRPVGMAQDSTAGPALCACRWGQHAPHAPLFRHSSTFTVTTVGGRAGCSPEVPSRPYSSTILWQLQSVCFSPLQLSWGLEFRPGLLGQVYSTSRTRRSSWVCFFLFFNSVKSCITYKLYPLRQERSSNKFSYSFCPFVRAEY